MEEETLAAHREAKQLRHQNDQHDLRKKEEGDKAKRVRDDYLDGLKMQLRYNSEVRAQTIMKDKNIPHFASPHGYPPIEEPTPTEVTRRRRQQASMVRTTLDF